MRPVELTMRGFRSYADEATFNWEGRGLVGIVGPIGSGKSSILDAVAFALFNQTPRVGRSTKTLINQRSDAAHVSLTFEVSGSVYRAVRALRRNGASQHTLYRVDDGAEEVLADRVDEMNQKILGLIGLDFDAFRRSVLLAQNQFAEFLEATPSDRNTVLKGVFGFERLDEMRALVRLRLEEVTGRLAGLESRRQTGDQDRKELKDRQTTLALAQARVELLEGLRGPVAEVAEKRQAAERELAEVTQAGERLSTVADRMPSKEATDAMLSDVREGLKALTEAEGAAEKAKRAQEEAVAARRELLGPIGGEEGLERASTAVSAWQAAVTAKELNEKQAADLREAAKLAKEAQSLANAALEEARAVAEGAAAAEAEAVASEEDARAAHHAAHETDRVAAVRSGLVVGEPCPVCLAVVSDVPPADASTDIGAAEKALAKASKAVAAARLANAEAASALATRTAEAAAAAQSLSETEAQLKEAAAQADTASAEAEASLERASEILGPGSPEESLVGLHAALRKATGQAEERTAEAEASTRALGALRARVDEGRSGMLQLAAEISNLAGALSVEIAVGDGPDDLNSALVSLREAWISQQTSADESRSSLQKALGELVGEHAELLASVGLAADDDLVEVIGSARADATSAGATIALLEKRLEDLDRLGAEEKELFASQELLSRLSGDLVPSKFLEFVLQDRRRSLADLAGVHFERLSGGRYRFSDDGEFDVIDLNAAESVRAPSSLSGGETFLASLALALALAEIVARQGGRLDAFFLDEGFGSLDAEHLGLAMDGVERLVSDRADRLVVIVSHVPAMTERIEDLIRLGRDELTGDTKVLQGAAAP